jgi:prepilin-type N-terminal cleavage/methylation domain-containing protein
LTTEPNRRITDQKGFTLIEIILVIVLLSLLAAFAVPRFVDLETRARQKAIEALKSEINSRETLIWADHKTSASGFVSDAKIFGELDLKFDPDYKWNPGDPRPTGGAVRFKGGFFAFSRKASTFQQPAVWTQK